MRKFTRRLSEGFNFILERQFVKGTHIQLFFVVALIGIISVVGGLLVLPTDEPASSFGESVWWAFLRLSDPGYLGDDEGTWRRMVSTLLTVAGYVVFMGSMVAIITSWLNRKIRTLEQGLTPVTANNHVVILGWTNRTVHIAAELFQSSKRVKKFLKRHGARVLKLIILSDNVTPFRLQELKDNRLIGKRAKEIILRSGEAINREHLRRVDSMHASAIIIPSPAVTNTELITPDVETIKTLLSLNSEAHTLKKNEKLPFVVAEIQDENKIKAAHRAYQGPLEVISSDTIISRLIAQNLHHIGLSAVFNELLSHSHNNNLYVLEIPEAAGKSIGALRGLFPKAILLGIVREEAETFVPLLNPGNDLYLEKTDRIILLASKMDDVEIAADSVKHITESIPKRPLKERPKADNYSGASKLLVLGWNHHIPALIKELGTYKNEKFHMTLASLRPLEARYLAINHILSEVSNITCEHIIADYLSETSIRALNPENFDHILLVSSDKLSASEEADARTIVGYTLLDDVLKSEPATRSPHIVMELSDPGNEILIKHFQSETIISPLILSNLLATVAMRRELFSVYRELFTVSGAEIIFRNLNEYDLEPGTVTSSDLENHIADYQDTFLGVYAKNASGQIGLKLNIPRNHTITLTKESLLVVLSTV
ncbi:MAG: hypothetical protein WD513_00685, partial [Balneolaceae bacterium]